MSSGDLFRIHNKAKFKGSSLHNSGFTVMDGLRLKARTTGQWFYRCDQVHAALKGVFEDFSTSSEPGLRSRAAPPHRARGGVLDMQTRSPLAQCASVA